jgi:hypothetical protein
MGHFALEFAHVNFVFSRGIFVHELVEEVAFLSKVISIKIVAVNIIETLVVRGFKGFGKVFGNEIVLNDRNVLDELIVTFGSNDQLFFDVVGAAGLLLIFLFQFTLVCLFFDVLRFGHVGS